MLFTVTTQKPIFEVARALEDAAKAHQFGVMHIHNLKETMQKKGVDLPHECLIFEVCQPLQAKKVLEQNMSISTALPCRISLYQKGDHTVLSTLKPTVLLGLFHEEALQEIAQEVEDTMIKMMQEAALGSAT